MYTGRHYLLLQKSLLQIFWWKPAQVAMSYKTVVAVCQMRSTECKEDNIETCKRLIASAKQRNAQMVFFPEGCDYVARNKTQTVEMAEQLDGTTLKCFMQMAQQHDLWLSLGGVHIRVDEETVRNAHLIINPQGKIVADYSKLHLFDVDYNEGNIHLKESSYCKFGDKIVPPIPTPVGNIGLSICYDLRFPELSMYLRMLGADILTYPSAFTFVTGASHWEVLLRARAIESQCYVVAAAQCGMHNEKRSSWGHAMIIDPWGTVIAQCSEGSNVAVAEIDHGLLQKTRLSMPVLQHRRKDIYPSLMPPHLVQIDCSVENKNFQFGQVFVKGRGIFAKTDLSIAFSNRKCVVRGHVLVSPIRCVPRFSELSPQEVVDLFALVHKVLPIVEEAFDATSSTITIQDGEDAGQSIKHVHVHILPRRPGDYLNNDDIYRDLATHDKVQEGWRTDEEIETEAQSLKSFIDWKLRQIKF